MVDKSAKNSLNRLFKSLFEFPNPVNEVAARMVAAMVLLLTVAIILTGEIWLAVFLAYGFWARVVTGPTLSPMGQLATRFLAPKSGIAPKLVAGPPKRFAQFVGLIFSTTALVLIYFFDEQSIANIILGVLGLFAFLESVVGFCAGCFVFSYMMRWGLVPESICEKCVVRQ